MTNEAFHRCAADALLAAYRTGAAIEPLSAGPNELSIDDAYAIQSLQIDAWRAEGRGIRGYKVGLTSAAMQAQLGVDQPDFGYLLDGMVERNGAAFDLGALIAPKVEPEIAVYLATDLTGPGVTEAEVAAAVDRVVGSIEVIDSRIADWRITLVDTIADNASSASAVVGSTSRALADIDVVGQRVILRRNGEVVGEGTGAAVLGSPIAAVTWLVNTLGRFGVTLHAGALVLPGSVCAAVAAAPGDRFSADFGELGTVEVSFAAAGEDDRKDAR